MQLSIIIPIYNTPIQNLKECMDSVCKLQNIKYEVLLIDDGSAEAVGDFCRSYQCAHPQCKYFYQENAGVSSARNRGLALAQGQKIMFVDSDDTVNADVIEKGCRIDADVVLFDMQVKNAVSEATPAIVWRAFTDRESSYVNQETAVERLICSNAIAGCYAKIIKKSLIEDNNIHFQDGMVIGEDQYFVGKILLVKPQIYYINEVIYCYEKNASNQDARYAKFPTRVIADGDRLAELKLSLLQEGRYDTAVRERLVSEIHNGMVISTGRWACVQIENRQFAADKKQLIEKRMKNHQINYSELDKKGKIFYWLLSHQIWWALYVVTHIRKFYLKMGFGFRGLKE